MKNEWKLLVILVLAVLVGRVSAQTPAALVEVDYVNASITTCQTHAGISTLCIGTDGFAFSTAGAGYGPNLAKQVAGPPGPVGATGPQGPPGPAGIGSVSSVNGKTGAVILAIQ